MGSSIALSANFELALFGALVTFYVVYADIFAYVRLIGGKLFQCPLCLGFWVGFVAGYNHNAVFPQDFLLCAYQGVVTGFLAFVISTITELVETKIDSMEK